MRSIRRLGVLGVALAGLAAWALADPAGQGVSLLAGNLVILAEVARGRPGRARRWVPITLVAGLGLVRGVIAGFPEPAGLVGLFLTLLLVFRRWADRGEGDDRASVLLGALLLALAAPAAGAWWPFPAVFLGISSLVALTPATLEGAGGRALRGPLWVGALVVFALSGAGWALGGAAATSRVGFSPSVALNDPGGLVEDPALVAEVRLDPDPGGPLYLRARALDHFDGLTWTTDEDVVRSSWQAPRGRGPEVVRMQVDLQDRRDGLLLVAGDVLGVEGAGTVGQERTGGLRVAAGPDPLVYELVLAGPLWPGLQLRTGEGPPGEHDAALPDGLEPEVVALGRQLAAGRPAAEAAEEVRKYLGTFRYSRAPRQGPVGDPVGAFLLSSQEGHCEVFAAAAAVLLRAGGHPARLVVGYLVPDAGGVREVSTKDAHAWVEVWNGQGWLGVEATPGAGAAPASTAPTLAGSWVDRSATPVGLLALVGLGGVVVFGLRWGWRAVRRGVGDPQAPVEAGPVGRDFETARRALERAGLWPESPEGPADRVRLLPDDLAAPMQRLVWWRYEERYGGPADASRRDEAARALRQLRTALRRRSRW